MDEYLLRKHHRFVPLSVTLSVTWFDLLLHEQICRQVITRLTAAYLYSGDFVRLL